MAVSGQDICGYRGRAKKVTKLVFQYINTIASKKK